MIWKEINKKHYCLFDENNILIAEIKKPPAIREWSVRINEIFCGWSPNERLAKARVEQLLQENGENK